MADVLENRSFVLEDNYRYRHNKVVTVLHSVINNYLKKSLVQPINHINKNTIKNI